MKVENYEIPDDLYYNTDYSWIKIEGDIATLGIIEPAAKLVNYFIYAKIVDRGSKLKKGDIYISLEAVKWTGHLRSPLSGEVIDTNPDIIDDPSIINREPYNKGWIIKLKMSNKKEIEDLKNAGEIIDWIKENLIKK